MRFLDLGLQFHSIVQEFRFAELGLLPYIIFVLLLERERHLFLLTRMKDLCIFSGTFCKQVCMFGFMHNILVQMLDLTVLTVLQFYSEGAQILSFSTFYLSFVLNPEPFCECGALVIIPIRPKGKKIE